MAKKPSDRPTAAEFAANLRAELITTQHQGSAIFGATDSSIIGLSHGSTLLTTPASLGAKAVPEPLARLAQTLNSRRALWLIAGAAAIVMTAVILIASLGGGSGQPAGSGQETFEFSVLFPNSPETYGVLPPDATPESTAAVTDRPPPFSWVGKMGTAGAAFVASKSGRHFYPINDPAAALITAENAVMYKNAEDARKDGKIPAP